MIFAVRSKRKKEISRLQRDSNPCPPRHRCVALPTGLYEALRKEEGTEKEGKQDGSQPQITEGKEHVLY